MGVEQFPIQVDDGMAWLLREQLRPGMAVSNAPDNAQEWQRWVFELRQKVNDTILRFLDEPDLNVLPIHIGEQEAWIIDAVVPYDGTGGSGTEILIQLFRGLWGLEFGLPTELVPEPLPIATAPDLTLT